MYARHDDDDFQAPEAAARTGVIRALSDLLARWRRESAENHAVQALARMDEHLLRDIGASRHNLERLIREGRDD
jgi:uncharacterized protein YjiS (DUF1127 family)